MTQELKAFNVTMEGCLFDLIKRGASVRQLQIVLESNRSLEDRNERQETPLMAAILNIHDPMKRKETLFLLLEYQANVNCINNRGQTPLMYACILDLNEELKILINDPRLQCNVQDFEGNTALMYACALGKMSAIETLVNACCAGQIQLNPYIMNLEGTSAFDYGRDYADGTMVKLLGRLITDESVYNFDQESHDGPHQDMKRACSRSRKGKRGKAKRIHQLADGVEIAKAPVSAQSKDRDSVAEPRSDTKRPIQSDNKIPSKKSFIVHLPRTYNEDENDPTQLTKDLPNKKRMSPSRNSRHAIDDQQPSTSGHLTNTSPSPDMPSTSGMASVSDKHSISGWPLTIGKHANSEEPSTSGSTKASSIISGRGKQSKSGKMAKSRTRSSPKMPSRSGKPSNQGASSTLGMSSNPGIPSTSGMRPKSELPSTSDMPYTSEMPSTSYMPSTADLSSTSAGIHPTTGSVHQRGKQRKNRKGKRTRKKKQIQTVDAHAPDIDILCAKPRDFGEEVAFGSKIYGTDLYPCSSGSNDCYGDVDKVLANIKLKVTDYMTPCHNEKERTTKPKPTGKMDCLQLSPTERAKLLSRTIWSVYGAPLPPIPISVATVHRVMSGITRLRQYLGKARYQPGRLLMLDPEMWCIVESIKHEMHLQAHSVFGF